MKNLYKKHHIASAMHNIQAFMNEVSETLGQEAIAPPTVAPVVAEPASDILYPSEQCGVNIPWIEFGNDIVSKPEWGKLSIAADSDLGRN